MSTHRLFALLAFVATSLPLAAEPGVVVSLASIGDRVRAQNPDLAAARLRIREALGRMNQSGRLANPELELGLQHDPAWRDRSFEIGFSQRFPVTDRLSLEKKVSLSEYKASEAEVREAERRIIAEARETVVKVLAIRKRRELLGEQAKLSNEFSAFLSDIAAKGEGSPLDAGQARIEAASLAVEMRQLDAAETAAVGALKPLLGVRPGGPLHVGGSLPVPAIPAGGVDLSKRPDLQAAKLSAAAATDGIALQESKRWEDVEGGFFAASERNQDYPEGFYQEAIVGLRFSFPLPLWNKNEGGIEEARAKKERMDLEVSALDRSIHLEADAAKAEMAEWAKLLADLGDNLIPLAEDQSAAAEDAFRKGQGELQAVFRSREKRLELSFARLDALREFHLARVRYEAAIGQP
jgi:cobalt-zinc-cadmium efflux system outer membrane protein